jgi:hypothetical protein
VTELIWLKIGISSTQFWTQQRTFGFPNPISLAFFRQHNFSHLKCNEQPQPLVILRSVSSSSLLSMVGICYSVKLRDIVTDNLSSQISHSIKKFTWTCQKKFMFLQKKRPAISFSGRRCNSKLSMCCNHFQLPHHQIRVTKKNNSHYSWNTDHVTDRTWISIYRTCRAVKSAEINVKWFWIIIQSTLK